MSTAEYNKKLAEEIKELERQFNLQAWEKLNEILSEVEYSMIDESENTKDLKKMKF